MTVKTRWLPTEPTERKMRLAFVREFSADCQHLRAKKRSARVGHRVVEVELCPLCGTYIIREEVQS